MYSVLKLASFALYVGLTVFLIGVVPGNAQQGPGGPPPSSANFSSQPPPPAYPANVYNGYQGAAGGYLSGGASVINAQGNMMVQQQQAFQMKEQYHQMKIDTRRKQLDEQLYERAVKPTEEDDRERARLEQVRRARNNPPPTEIWAGKALNELLLAIQQQQAKGVQGPNVPLQPNLLQHINVTGGQTGGSIGLLRNGGKLDWPFTLRTSDYDSDRKNMDKLALAAYNQAGSGQVDADTIQGMTNEVNTLMGQLKSNIDNISANDYIKAKRYLNDMNGTITALQDPNVANYVNRKWTAQGNNVAQLTQEMGQQGLRFAPATPGDESAYTSLHTRMVAYFIYPDKPWDPLAK
jgi:hypothetical protein